MFADLTLLIEDSIAQAGVLSPEELKRVEKRGWGAGELDFAALLGKIAEWTGNVECDAHSLWVSASGVWISARLPVFSDEVARMVWRRGRQEAFRPQ